MRTLILLLCVGLLLSMLPLDAAADDVPEDVVEAVRTSTVVQAEMSRVRKRINAKESAREEIKVLKIGSICGIAGCSTSYLAVITAHRRGVNPQSGTVLATVQRSTRGSLGKVSVVELKAKGVEETRLEVQRKYSSPLPIIRAE